MKVKILVVFVGLLLFSCKKKTNEPNLEKPKAFVQISDSILENAVIYEANIRTIFF